MLSRLSLAQQLAANPVGAWVPNLELFTPRRRYQDSFDDVNNIIVNVAPTTASSIETLGSPDKFLADQSYLLGQSSFFGALNCHKTSSRSIQHPKR